MGDAQKKATLLAEINQEIPKNVDWYKGARDYVQAEIKKHGKEAYRRYMLSKPFGKVPPGDDGGVALIENAAYLSNFTNAARFLNLPGGSKILDVACGSGWVSHFFALMNYDAYGFDICEDMVELARERFRREPHFDYSETDLAARFFVLNIEAKPLPKHAIGIFDVIVLESCMHHFLDPIAAISHLIDGLKFDGLVLILEGEARQGTIRLEYVDVMNEFQTLERPYTRAQFEQILDLAGLRCREFLGRTPGWVADRDPAVASLPEIVKGDAAALNFAICAKHPRALDRVFPFRTNL